MTTYARVNTTGLTWTNTAAWSPAGAPTTSADKAQFTSAITTTNNTVGATATVGQIEIIAPVVTATVSAVTGQIITLSPSASFSDVGILFTGTTGSSVTISAALALASDQTWNFGTSNKTLTISSASNVLQNAAGGGTYGLTLTGLGRLSSAQANTFGGVGKTITLQNGVVCEPGAAGTLGSLNNTIYVGPNSYLDLFTRALNQTNYYVTGVGTLGYLTTIVGNQFYGAVAIGSVFDGTKNLLFTGTSAAITLQSATIEGKLTGSVTDYIEISANTSTISAITNTNNDFYAPGGVRINSRAQTGNLLNRSFNVGATDAAAGGVNESAPFGDIRNTIRVLPAGRLYSAPASVTRKVLRDITFDGDAANTHMQNAGTTATSILEFAGALTLSGNATNGAEVSSSSASGGVVYTGTIAGTGALRCVTASSKVTFDSIEPSAFTSWMGQLQTPSNVVVIYKNGYETLTNSRTTGTGVNLYATNGLNSNITLAHSSYTGGGDFVVGSLSSGRTISFGGGSVTASVDTNFYVENAAAVNTTVLFPGNITGQLVFGNATFDSPTATMVVSGTNTRLGSTASVGWTGASNLSLNSAGAFGSGSAAIDAIVIQSTAVLDNSSVSSVTLSNGGVKQLDASFSWAGTNDLNMGLGNVTYSTDRTITFTAGANTGTLKFPGAATTTTATLSFRVGGSTAGAKQRITLGGANASLVAATAADQHSVTAGYFRIENNNGLGAAGTTTAWWVGATNLGAQTTKAALELAGVTTPDTKNVNLYNIGPNDDGALIGVSGTSVFGGAISVPNVAGTRIGVKSGATLTLLGSGLYQNLNPTNSGTPLAFTAESGGTLNQNRILGSNVGTVTVTGGSGTVVFSRANLHTGTMTCSAGTTKVTDVNATSTGSVTVSAGATLESTVQSQFQSTLSLGTLSSASPAILKFAA